MKISELKKLVKLILKEELNPTQVTHDNRDVSLVDPILGHRAAHKILGEIIKDHKQIIKAANEKNNEEGCKWVKISFRHGQTFYNFMVEWLINVWNIDKTKEDILEKYSEDLRTGLNQSFNQLNLASKNIKFYGNYVNAYKELQHLNEIYKNLSLLIDKVFNYKENKKRIKIPPKK